MLLRLIRSIEGELLAIIAKEAKQRRESIAQFEKGNRSDLVEREQAELDILTSYLPQQLSREEIEVQARRIIEEIAIPLPRPRQIELQETAQFGHLRARVRKLIQH